MNEVALRNFRPLRVKINDWHFMVSRDYACAGHKLKLSSVAGYPSRERTFWCEDCQKSVSALACKK